MTDFCKFALSVIEVEAQAVFSLTDRVNENFNRACELILNCKGRVVVTGMGKSGHIGKKIAATLASTGTPAFFMHPGEASHGDLGMITSQDVVLALSNSGNTSEVVLLLPLLKRIGVPLICFSGNPNSTLSIAADVNIDLTIESEACPLGLAPTTSTTIALVMGDALAISLLQARGFSAKDFALSHPSGSLGKKLLLKVDELCHRGDDLPSVRENATVSEALIEVTQKKLGMTCVTNEKGQLSGIYTDGDIRRTLNDQHDIHTTLINQVMTKSCVTIKDGMLAAEALHIMQEKKISSLVTLDNKHLPTGVVHLHDLLKAGVY